MSNMSNMFNSLFGSLRGEGAPGNNEDIPYQRTQPNELRRTAAGRRADRQNTVESLIGPLESIALTVPLPDDPISEDWEHVDRVPVVGQGDGHQAGRNGTDDAERRARMRAQFRRVAAEMAEAGRQLAVVGSDSTQVILTRLQGLHAELTNLIANGGDGALTEVMTTFQQNLPDFHWIMHHPTEIGFQTWTSLQGHAAAAMNGLQGVVNFLFDEAEEEFDPNMQRSFAHLSHIIEQPAIPATEPAEDLDGEDAWILPEGPNSEEVKLVLCQKQQAEEEAEEEKEEEDKEDEEDQDEDEEEEEEEL